MQAYNFEYDYNFDWVIKKTEKRKAAERQKEQHDRSKENQVKRGAIAKQPKGDCTIVLSENKNKRTSGLATKKTTGSKAYGPTGKRRQKHPLISNSSSTMRNRVIAPSTASRSVRTGYKMPEHR